MKKIIIEQIDVCFTGDWPPCSLPGVYISIPKRCKGETQYRWLFHEWAHNFRIAKMSLTYAESEFLAELLCYWLCRKCGVSTRGIRKNMLDWGTECDIFRLYPMAKILWTESEGLQYARSFS